MSKMKKKVMYLVMIMTITICMTGSVLASSVSTIVSEISKENLSKIEIGVGEQVDENTEENEELDPNSYINMPITISNGKGTITISSEVDEEYALEYQFIEIADSDFQQMETIANELQEYYGNAQTEREELLAEIDALQEDYDVKNEEDPSSDETLAAAELLNTKIEEYNNRMNEINEQIIQYNESIESMIPSYDDTKWIETQDGEIDVQTSNIDMTMAGTKHMVLWVRLQVGQETYYDRDVYSTTITQDDDENNTDNTSDKEKNNTNNADDNTVANQDLPKAGQFSMIIFIVVALIATGTMYIGYKKYRDIK